MWDLHGHADPFRRPCVESGPSVTILPLPGDGLNEGQRGSVTFVERVDGTRREARLMIVEQWWHDVQLAGRGLRRAKAFTGAAVLTLAVGIAATTAMFALVQGVLLRPLPVREEERLVVAWMALPETGATHWAFRAPDVEVIGKESRVLESVAGVSYYGAIHLVAVENGHASPISGAAVAGDFFRVVGVPPILGRALSPADDVKGAENVLLGLTSRLEADAPPDAPRGLTPVVRFYRDVVVGDVRPALLMLFGAVGLVLLIASANVANLLLLRGEVRRPELTVRAALGASGGRLARELLAESLLLALAAGVVGLAVTWWTLHALVALVPDGLPRVDSVRIDAGVVLFTVGVAFLTAALAGLAPALSLARVDLAAHLRSGGRGATGGAARRGRRGLVVAQVALAVTVVATAGLLTRSLLHLQGVDMGLAKDRLVFVRLVLPHAKYADDTRHRQFLKDVVAQLEAVPGIGGATPVNTPPFAGTGGWDAPEFTAEGQSADRAATNPSLNLESVHPNYFATFEVTLVRGRAFAETDGRGAPEVAIVSEDVAALTWPGEDPIGKRLKLGHSDSTADWRAWRTVVGVARPTRYRELAAPRPTLYLPVGQFIAAAEMFVLRTSSPLALVAPEVRARVRAVDPAVQVVQVAPFREMLQGPLARPRFNAFLIGMFGMIALLLAAIGLYAVMAAHVRQRYSEIGVRVALGATTADVRGLVLGEGLRLAGMGAAIGLASAVVATRLLRGLLFDVHPLDPASFLAAAMLLMGVSALASYLPARRATRVDPIVLLR